MKNKKLLPMLLYLTAAAGLRAQTEIPPVAGINRPQRSINQDSIAGSSLPFHHSFLPAPNSLLLTPEALQQPLTQKYINDYSGPGGIKWLNSTIRNGKIYLPYIREEIAGCGLPPELAFLPIIESEYLSTAQSKSGAMGLWQFMMNSISPFGIRVNELLDERRDFRKSTAAALRKLEDNYRVLGNWPLALAAYNAGLGGVSRAVQRAKTSDYWALCNAKELKTETIQYVPKLLAVSYILSNPRRFGVDYWPETTEWTCIKTEKQASLDIIASESGAEKNMLYRLNPELLYGITPADKNYELKVPAAYQEKITGILNNTESRLLHYYSYRIQYGDTLSALSRHYGISLNLIEQHNPGILSRYLKIGETIIIPAFRETAPYQGTAETASLPAEMQNQPVGNLWETYVVVKGDTLWSLAIRYGIDPQVLAAENNMELNQILSVGKVLKVPIIRSGE